MNLNIPILMYHQVSENPHPSFLEYTVTPKAFESQMKALKMLGFKTITFDQLTANREGKGKLPRKPVIVTFDDGLTEAIEHSVPILENLGFAAVYYMPTNYMGIKSSWMVPEIDAEFPIVDWSTVRDLDSRGFEIGSHTMSHPWLNRITPEECYKELEGSRKKLEDFLGHEVRHIAYPFGAHNEQVKIIAGETGYYTACTTERFIANTDCNMFSLPRLNIGMQESLLDFILQIHTTKITTHDLRAKVPGPLRRFVKRYLLGRKTS
jgi:peptidoglycan/xylan/chitin deacetylase (PgdA/CDA1 family)